jgi:hypothetical protein
VKFLSIDQHIAVSADIRNIFNYFGHTVHELSLSAHAGLLGRPVSNLQMLSGDAWCSTIHNRKFDEFYDLYKDRFHDYDGFICCYPPIFSMLYKKFNKPIIIQIPVRYECGADCNGDLWEEFNQYLRDGVDNGMIFLCANNRYDQKYAQELIEREIKWVPSLCEYTGMRYNPVNSQFLYYASFRIKDDSGRMIKKHDAMPGGHAWQNVGDYSGVFHYPYNVSTMSIAEQYMACIPLFFPTKRYLMKMWLENIRVLDQISWQQQRNEHAHTHTIIKNRFEYDPNNFRDFNCVSHWIDYADFYNNQLMKNINYFDSQDERNELLSMDRDKLIEISRKMRTENNIRRMVVYHVWTKILENIKHL